MFEITFTDSGKTFNWTLKECQKWFGKDEFVEIAAGYLPHIVAVKLW